MFLQSIGCKIAFCGSEKSERAATSNRKDWFSMCLKTIQGGYDGKGQVVLKCEEDFSQATELLANATCELEKWVPFTKELSIIVAGNKHGYQSFPVSENIHRKEYLA